MKNFALIGVAGYIANRHLKAIKETGNNLVASLDKFDQVGILDSFFPEADFFTEFERFDRHLDKLKRQGMPIDYVSICTPNYLHDAHIRFALKHQARAICEKPLVLNPWNIDALKEIEKETGQQVFTILQLRLHPVIIELKNKIQINPQRKIRDVVLTYITSRGKWYHISWKGDVSKSGGIATNIGIHFFDMLIFIFGNVRHSEVHISQGDRMSGYLELDYARVRWFLSINSEDLPEVAVEAGKRTFRSISIDEEEVEFSEGFTDLHTKSYKAILEGNGFRLEDAAPSIHTTYSIRNAKSTSSRDNHHPFIEALKLR